MNVFRLLRDAALTAAIVTMAMAWPVMAADNPPPAVEPGPGVTVERGVTERPANPHVMMTHWLIGHKVVNDRGQDLGVVRDIVLSPTLESISYVVVAKGGVLGIGDTLFAVPPTAFSVDPSTKTVVLPVEKARFDDRTAAFSKDSWPEEARGDWPTAKGGWAALGPPKVDRSGGLAKAAKEVGKGVLKVGEEIKEAGGSAESSIKKEDQEHERIQVGTTPDQLKAGGPFFKFRRMTELVGMAVRGTSGEGIANVEDLVIDGRGLKVIFAQVGFGGVAGIGEKHAVLPWNAVKLQPTTESIAIPADKPTLERLAFTEPSEVFLSNPENMRRSYTLFHATPYWEVYGYEEPGTAHGTGTDAWRAGSDYGKNFKPDAIVEQNAVVESVGTFVPAPGALPGLRLRVRTEDGKMYVVHGGPMSYVRAQGMELRPGDKIHLVASRTRINDRDVLMATVIHKGDKALELRDRKGEPKWKIDELKAEETK